MGQTLKDIMSSNVICCTPDEPVQAAADLMRKHNIGCIPVTENGRFEGIITDRDITLRSAAVGKESNQMTVRECMSNHALISGSPDMNVQEAAKMMAEHQIRRLPVVENGQVVGMVALADLATEEQFDHEAEKALAGISEPGGR
ncbi:CBS domain-containing protein [Sporolactobacillus sp. CPB3-1]|uniref:CBS domain-containing protein n=1 Tax=Sporolactobacillus mangiferae TaxID=2940498 RepID=A0ABT0MDF5_9BACL|nr:CBS domain-containing protein [Sporolactobacillus mangiferae]MCL1632907.1 CBS domain-containing protein [Sporolactobacillus mangiferae]